MPVPQRQLNNFIGTFISTTEPIGSPAIFRRWIAISLIGSALGQNVWVKTHTRLYPNLYTFLIAHPGVGKTQVINYGREIIAKVKGLHVAPISVTFASMVDSLVASQREVIRQPEGRITYNSMSIIADELGAFIHKYDNEMIAGLTAFYDPTPYQQKRRTGGADNQGIHLEIASPQLNILAGSTPTNLMTFLPESAWGQGFTSRVILVFSDQRQVVDDFADHGERRTADLVHDLQQISKLYGIFTVDPAYRAAVNQWKAAGELPVPGHPRLVHYTTRRRVHLYKLSMIAAVNRSDALELTEPDFFTALEWLVSAERQMPDIFKAGVTNADSQAQDDIVHWIRTVDLGPGVAEQRIIQYARDRIPIHSILRIIDILENSGQIREVSRDKRTLARYFAATPSDTPTAPSSLIPIDQLLRPNSDPAAG